ncbi:glutamate--cysteine ligase [soil metagenome]
MSTRIAGRDDPAAWERISAEEFAHYFEFGAKPRGEWRVGAEFEKFAVERETGRAITYGEPNGLRDLLQLLVDHFQWEPHYEGEHLTTLSRDGATVSFEPGGQVEFSTSAVVTVQELALQLEQHCKELQQVAPQSMKFVAAGVHPFARVEDIPLGIRSRHAVMAEYLSPLAPHALAMMKATASTQATFDYSSEADAITKFTVALKLSPIINALWANSAIVAGTVSGYQSYRSHIWHGMDPVRSGFLVDLLNDGLSFERWTRYLLDVPMLFHHHHGHYTPASGRSFRDYLRQGIDGHFPTRADWELHLTTVFPEARLKHFLEVRGADANPPALALAVPAFWKGIFYDEQALAAAKVIADEFANDEMPVLSEAAAVKGLDATIAGQSLLDWNRQIVTIAQQGLQRQAVAYHHADESGFLTPLQELLERRTTPAAQSILRGVNSLGPLIEY